jgi:hypothetical protein
MISPLFSLTTKNLVLIIDDLIWNAFKKGKGLFMRLDGQFTGEVLGGNQIYL